MGIKMRHSYPYLFVGYIENQSEPKPEPCCRYIDDCVGATSSTQSSYNCC